MSTDFLSYFNIFDPSLLQDEESLTVALEVLEGTVDSDTAEAIVKQAVEVPHALEFMLSATTADAFNILSSRILDGFPGSLDAIPANKWHLSLLSRFAKFLTFLPYPTRDDEPGQLHTCSRAVDIAPPVLVELEGMLADPSMLMGDDAGTPVSPSKKKIPPPRGERRSQAARRATTFVDPKPFQVMDVQIPTFLTEVGDLAAHILLDQKNILKYFMEILRRPALRPIIKSAYISLGLATTSRNDTRSGAVSPLSESPMSPSEPTAIAQQPIEAVAPFRAALYEQSAKGLGEWRIWLSGRAEEDLRKRKKADATSFGILMKKLGELSHGQFSETNMKRITGPQTPVHIYEARLPGDFRIVYQVDCMQEFQSNSEHQVLTIHGIMGHTEIRRSVWERIGRLLGRRGKSYQQRCKYRDHPRHIGEDIYLPAAFDGIHEHEEINDDLHLAEEVLDEEDQAQMQALLVHEKYVALSEAVIRSILSDGPLAHVHRLSSLEQEVVEYPYSCYVLGRSGTGKTTTMLFKMVGIEKAWYESDRLLPRPRQVFVTKSRMLADKVEDYLMKLLASTISTEEDEDLAGVARWRQKGPRVRDLINIEEDDQWRADLPRKFSDLRDEHFPLAVSYDVLCTMLEADLFEDVKKVSRWQLNNRRIISWEVFQDDYWRRFSQNFKGLAPTMVYGEILGVIKGSEATLKLPSRALDRLTYEGMGGRGQHTSTNERQRLYDFYERYAKRKREVGDCDPADRTHDLLNAIRAKKFPGRKADYLYVDEVQDLLLIDTLVLRCICQNASGLFWAGDTAQTISRGSVFQFSHLTAFLHRVEKTERGAAMRTKGSGKPQFFQLLVNYRSHGGIVDCAHSTIELIQTFWPNSIDILQRERGLVAGSRPIFLSDWTDAQEESFFRIDEEGIPIELGAHQCILVRNNVVRDELKSRLGKIGAILSLYDSKGLEYNDVILYDFFEDSLVDHAQWRRLTHTGNPNPEICIELKFLYVAITRARNRLVFMDRSHTSEPMKTYWQCKNLVDIRTDADSVLAKFAKRSTPEEWAGRARQYFDFQQYDLAETAYRHAQMRREEGISSAYALQAGAGSTVEGKPRTHAFTLAGDAFSKAAADPKNSEKERTTFYAQSGHCYSQADKHSKAAASFAEASLWTRAVVHYQKARMLDEAVSIVMAHQDEIERTIVDKVMNTARYTYLSQERPDKADILFTSTEEKVEFMVEHDFGVAHATVLEGQGRFSEAADLRLQEGDVLYAISLLIQDQNCPASYRLAASIGLEDLWGTLFFYDGHTEDTAKRLEALFDLMGQLGIDALNTTQIQELGIFKALHWSDPESLSSLVGSMVNSTRYKHSKPLTLLALDRFFSDMSSIPLTTQDEVSQCTLLFLQYTRLIRDSISQSTPDNTGLLQKMFTLAHSSDEHVTIRRGTYLHRWYTQEIGATDGVKISVELARFVQVFRTYLGRHLWHRIQAQLKIISGYDGRNRTSPYALMLFEPCPIAALSDDGRCTQGGCPLVHTFDVAWFNKQLGVHLHQMMILDMAQDVCTAVYDFPTRMRNSRIWLDRLDTVLRPLLPRHGNLMRLRLNLIPEAPAACRMLKRWAHDILYYLDPTRPELQRFFLNNFFKATTIGHIVDEPSMNRTLERVYCVRRYYHPALRIRPQIQTGQRDINALHALVELLRAQEPSALVRGTLFLKYIVDVGVRVDAAVMCVYIERLCAFFILARSHQARNSVHSLVLPELWLFEAWREFDRVKEMTSRWYRTLVDPVKRFMGHVVARGFQPGSPYWRPRELSPFDSITAIIARLCRALSLLAYNIADPILQTEVFVAIKSIPWKDNWTSHQLCRAWIGCNSWRDLRHTLLDPSTGRALGGLVQLYCDRFTQQRPLPDYPHRLLYHRIHDISRLIDPEPEFSRLSISEDTRTASEDLTLESIPQTDDSRPEESFASIDSDAAIPESLESSATTASRIIVTSAEEKEAADIMTRACRRAMRRRNDLKATKGFAATRRLFQECLSRSQTIEWPIRRSLHVFLAALPHLLWSIDWAIERAEEMKEDVKRQRKAGASEESLEKALEMHIKASRILKCSKTIRGLVHPDAPVYATGILDLAALHGHSGDVAELLGELGLGSKVQGDFDIAYCIINRALERERQTVGIRHGRKMQRPVLNTEDL